MDLDHVSLLMRITEIEETLNRCIGQDTHMDYAQCKIYVRNHTYLMPTLFPILAQNGLTSWISKVQFKTTPSLCTPMHRSLASLVPRRYINLNGLNRSNYYHNTQLHRSMIKYSARKMHAVRVQRQLDGQLPSFQEIYN